MRRLGPLTLLLALSACNLPPLPKAEDPSREPEVRAPRQADTAAHDPAPPPPPPPRQPEPEPIAVQSQAVFERNADVDLDAAGVKSLRLVAGEGHLVVTVISEARNIRTEARISCRAENLQEAERIAHEIRLTSESVGTENPVLELVEPRLSPSQSYFANLTVKLPAGIRVEIVDGGGDIEIAGLRSGLSVESRDGSVEIYDVKGGVTVKTSGGSCFVDTVTGRIEVEDGGGDLVISGVTGEIHVMDSSGKLEIRNVSGNVFAQNNPDGAVIQNIDGDVTLSKIAYSKTKLQGVVGKLTFQEGGAP